MTDLSFMYELLVINLTIAHGDMLEVMEMVDFLVFSVILRTFLSGEQDFAALIGQPNRVREGFHIREG